MNNNVNIQKFKIGIERSFHYVVMEQFFKHMEKEKLTETSVPKIREWMKNFAHITPLAKWECMKLIVDELPFRNCRLVSEM